MNIKTKKTLLIGTIIILLVVNISALSTIIYNKKVRAKMEDEISNVQDGIRIQGMRRFLQEELNLSEEQFHKFKDINTNYNRDSRKIAFQMRKKRYEMMKEIAKKNPNFGNLDQIAQDIGSLHYELKKLTINHFIELKDVCDEEQQEILHKMFIQMLSIQDGERMEKKQRGNNRDGQEKHRRRNRKGND